MGICGNSQESFTGTSSENVDSNSEEFLITYSLEFLETHSQEFLVTHSWKFHVKWRISLNQIRGISHIFFLKDGSEVNFYFLSIRMQRQRREPQRHLLEINRTWKFLMNCWEFLEKNSREILRNFSKLSLLFCSPKNRKIVNQALRISREFPEIYSKEILRNFSRKNSWETLRNFLRLGILFNFLKNP